MGVVLSWWGGGGPWLGGFVGCPWRGFLVAWVIVTLYMVVWRVRGTPPPLEVSVSSFVLIHLALVF